MSETKISTVFKQKNLFLGLSLLAEFALKTVLVLSLPIPVSLGLTGFLSALFYVLIAVVIF